MLSTPKSTPVTTPLRKLCCKDCAADRLHFLRGRALRAQRVAPALPASRIRIQYAPVDGSSLLEAGLILLCPFDTFALYLVGKVDFLQLDHVDVTAQVGRQLGHEGYELF